MKWRRLTEFAETKPVVIYGAPFTFRSLHPFNGHAGWRLLPEITLDRVITVTLPAVGGLRHHEPANMKVVL
jgi:hypothetical protein